MYISPSPNFSFSLPSHPFNPLAPPVYMALFGTASANSACGKIISWKNLASLASRVSRAARENPSFLLTCGHMMSSQCDVFFLVCLRRYPITPLLLYISPNPTLIPTSCSRHRHHLHLTILSTPSPPPKSALRPSPIRCCHPHHSYPPPFPSFHHRHHLILTLDLTNQPLPLSIKG